MGTENLAYYVMSSGFLRKAFCKTCGVHIMNQLNDLTEEQVAALPEQAQVWRPRMMGCQPINLRTLDDFDFKTLKTLKLDGYNLAKPPYVNP